MRDNKRHSRVPTTRENPPTTTKIRAMCSTQRAEWEPEKRHWVCAAELPWYLWLDGRMDEHMTTCTQRATSHKCSILFSNNTLRPVSSHFGLLCSGLWPTLAFISLLQSNFGACRGHQGWGQFTVSSVPLKLNLLMIQHLYIYLELFLTGNQQAFSCSRKRFLMAKHLKIFI